MWMALRAWYLEKKEARQIRRIALQFPRVHALKHFNQVSVIRPPRLPKPSGTASRVGTGIRLLKRG